MHFVCSPFGSSGDVHPMIGVALALKSRGHDVTFICSGYFEDLIRGRSLDYVQLGTKEEFLALTEREELWKPYQAFQFLYREGVARTMHEHFDMLADFQRQGPLAVVSNLFGFGARVAQEKLGIPLVTLHLQPAVIWSDVQPPTFPGSLGPRWLKSLMYNAAERFVIDRTVCPSLNEWRAELGLTPVRQVTRWWHSPLCVACLFPDWFAKPQSDWPPNVIQTSFPLWDERDEDHLPSDVADFLSAGEAPIAFTPGSANIFGGSFFRAAVDACRALGRRGLLLTRFPDQLPSSLPDSMLHVPFVPFSQLLPRCAALVHHGGIGSMSQAMAAGIPQLIVAIAHDQFDNGQRVRILGVGEMVNHRSLSAPKVIGGLERLLDSAAVKRRCVDLSNRLAHKNGTDEMAKAIEQRIEKGSA